MKEQQQKERRIFFSTLLHFYYDFATLPFSSVLTLNVVLNNSDSYRSNFYYNYNQFCAERHLNVCLNVFFCILTNQTRFYVIFHVYAHLHGRSLKDDFEVYYFVSEIYFINISKNTHTHTPNNDLYIFHP